MQIILGDQAMKFAVRFEVGVIAARQLIHPPKSCVVASGLVFFAGVA
jgi:hypothetical protein